MKISEQLLRESFTKRELSMGLPIIIFDSVDSTNTAARKYIEKTDVDRALFIANTQSRGRGRLGRSFISPEGGLYMTLAVRLDEKIEVPALITAYTAVTVRRAIYELCATECEIKWVNDLLFGGKKLSGILTEGVICPDTGKVKYAIVGIGVNITGKLNPEIEDIATTLELCGNVTAREELAARITELFFSRLDLAFTKETADEYRRRSMLIGKEVTVIKKSVTYPAKVIGISDKCELELKLCTGECELLSTGEVSVRVK